MVTSLDTASFRARDYAFLDTPISGILEQLKCPICLQLPAEPVFTSCGHAHSFCKDCIKDPTSCPLCHRIEGFTISPDVKIEQIVNNLRVKCKACEWVGQLGDAIEHLEDKCEQQTDCPLGCGEKMKLSNNVIEWKSEIKCHTRHHCLNRPFKCPYCGHCGVCKDVTSTHLTTCEELPLPCPGKCWPQLKIARKHMKQHLSIECPKEYVACRKYYMFGGCSLFERWHTNAHLAEKLYPSHVPETIAKAAALRKFCLSSSDTMPDLYPLPLSFRPWLQNNPKFTRFPCLPCIFQMKGFADAWEHYTDMAKASPWPLVHSHFGGYIVTLRVSRNSTNHRHVMVSMCIWENEGGYDSLKVPFKGAVTVSLLNQEQDSNHCTKVSLTPQNYHTTGYRFDGKDIQAKVVEWNFLHFISHENLENSEKNTAYLKNDTLFFRIEMHV